MLAHDAMVLNRQNIHVGSQTMSLHMTERRVSSSAARIMHAVEQADILGSVWQTMILNLGASHR